MERRVFGVQMFDQLVAKNHIHGALRKIKIVTVVENYLDVIGRRRVTDLTGYIDRVKFPHMLGELERKTAVARSEFKEDACGIRERFDERNFLLD